jgi:hypothetical protein
VEGVQGGAAEVAGEADPRRAHPPFHVRPGGEGQVDEGVLPPGEDMEEHPQPEVGHADLVNVGEDEGHAHLARPGTAEGRRPPLPAQVARGPLHLGEEAVVLLLALHAPVVSPSPIVGRKPPRIRVEAGGSEILAQRARLGRAFRT